MKTSVVGVGRPVWVVPHDARASYLSGKGTTARSPKLHQQTSTSLSASGADTTIARISRLVSSNRSGAINFNGLRSIPKTKDASQFGSRFGDFTGDCCQPSIGAGSSSSLRDKGVKATAGSGAKGSGDSRSDGDEAGSSSVWDLPSRHKRIQAAAAKVGDPFRDMMTNASKKLQDYLDNIKHSKAKDEPDIRKPESEWEEWQRFFGEVDERESLLSVLKFQLEEAVHNEDFQEAAMLKQTIASVISSDTISEIMNGLKTSLDEERYSDAARLRDKGGAGLVGWWVGLAEGGNDPYGRIIHIAALQGRYVAKSYSARQLATAATGIPLFEVFVRKEGDQEYKKQFLRACLTEKNSRVVSAAPLRLKYRCHGCDGQGTAVYLQRDGSVSADVVVGSTLKEVDVSGLDPKSDVKENAKTEDTPTASDKNQDKSKDADFIDEGLNNILSFLKERMPDVKLKVLQVIAPNGLETDIPKLVEQLMEAEEKEEKVMEGGAEVSGSSESSAVGQSEQEKITAGSSNTSSSPEEQETPVRLVVGGVLQSNIDDKVPRPPVRVAAKIEHNNKDEFIFHIEDTGTLSTAPTTTSSKESFPSWKVATIATQASADLMPDDVAKVLWNVEKVPVKVSKEMGEIIRLAVSQAQRRRGLSKSTSFRRVNVSDAGADPLSGLYIGAFGPYTSEVVQLRRKYGQWQEEGASPSGDKLEFFEYVEAVKLTGDLNVPAGQVTFRAKIGRENRLSLRGAYPDELGVIGRYKGQGRLAEPGFRNPQWIDGEMVLLDGKQGGGHTNGAELGFVYSVPERHFLVLFNRLKLQD